MNMKKSKTESISPSSLMEESLLIEREEIAFGPPLEEYSYRCSKCECEMLVNEAIIDVELGIAEFEDLWYEGFMPVLGCPNPSLRLMRCHMEKS